MLTLFPPTLNEALEAHRGGDWESAERLYRAILDNHPAHAEAMHLLGVLAFQRGQLDESVERIEQAIAFQPNAAVFHGNLGEAYRASGQARKAAASYQTALRLDPALPHVAVRFGSLLLSAGQLQEAKNLFHFALKHWPNSALAYNGLGNVCRLLEDQEEALRHFRRATELNPQLALAHVNLGQQLLDCGRAREALPICREAVRLQPDSAAAHNNLGNVLRELGELTESKACYRMAVRLAPDMAMFHDNLGQLSADAGQTEVAARCFENAVRLDPDNPRYRVNLAGARIERREFAAAEEQARIVLANDPRNLDAIFVRAKLLSEQGRLAEAQKQYRTLLQAHPEHPRLNYLLGQLLLETNEREKALACFRTALRGNPRYAPPFARLAAILGGELPAEEEAALRRLAVDPDVSDAERSSFLFGLGQVCDSRSAFAEAASHLEQANALELAARRRRGQDYQREVHVRFVDRLLATFTPELFARGRDVGLDSERPVFIVGLPRSGTSLLEQVLASHSRVFGAGELRLVRETFEELGRDADGVCENRSLDALSVLDAEAMRRLAQRHLDQLAALDSTADRILDKMPDNYMYLGFLTLLFPQARFLHCRRDPRDVAVSCWITQFQQIDWANDLEDIASRFEQYQRLMEHWRRVLPAMVLDVNYEDLVSDPEGTARGVLAFCGLNWEPACLEFYRSRRPVRTASVMQVRQPLYRGSVGRWRNYESALQPLFARLESAGR